MISRNGFVASALTVAFMGSAIAAPITALASEQGRRNTTLGLGAGAAALLLTQKNALPGILVGAGAIYAYSRYQNDINARHRRQRAAAYYRHRRAVAYRHSRRRHG